MRNARANKQRYGCDLIYKKSVSVECCGKEKSMLNAKETRHYLATNAVKQTWTCMVETV